MGERDETCPAESRRPAITGDPTRESAASASFLPRLKPIINAV
jgi:hypothetical protein